MIISSLHVQHKIKSISLLVLSHVSFSFTFTSFSFAENANFGSTNSGLESKPSLPRNRISSVEQYLVSLSGLNERFSSNDALDSLGDLDDGKTDSIDGMLEDRDDLESLVSDIRQDLPGWFNVIFIMKLENHRRYFELFLLNI